MNNTEAINILDNDNPILINNTKFSLARHKGIDALYDVDAVKIIFEDIIQELQKNLDMANECKNDEYISKGLELSIKIIKRKLKEYEG